VPITYLQVAEEPEQEGQEGRHLLRLGTAEPGDLAALDLTPCGTVAADPPADPDGTSLWALLVQHAEPGLAGALDAADAVVLDIRPERLAGLPWELLERPPTSPHPPLAFLDPQRAWSRGRWTQLPEASDATLGPMRLLVVVCDPTDPYLRSDDELDGIHAALKGAPGRIHLEVIDSPGNWAALRREIETRAPHVVHLIGHTRQGETGAVIEFSNRPDNDETGEVETWELPASVLRQSWPAGPWLAVLSACRTQTEEATGVQALTDALRNRVPAVIGMRGDIRSEAAVAFARNFYGRLAEGGTVDSAAAAGRLEVFDTDNQQPDWSYPVLETRSPAGLVLPVRLGVTEPEALKVRQISEFAKLTRFVDRAELRRKTWWAIDAEGLPGARPERSAVIITGERGDGKTWLAQASMMTCYLRGRRLQYVDLSGKSRDWLGTLRALRDGMEGCELSAPMPGDAFGSFTARLNWLVRRPPSVDMPADDAQAQPDLYEVFDPEPGQAPERIRMIFSDFLEALQRSARDRPVIVAIDGIREIDDTSWKEHLMPQLIRPLARGVPGIRMLLVVPNDLVGDRVPGEVDDVTERIAVCAFPLPQIPRLIREYGVRNEWTGAQIMHTIEYLKGIATTSVSPSLLEEIRKTVSMAARGAR
jgi:hypothetical protein